MYKSKQKTFDQTLSKFCGEALYKFPPALRESILYSLVESGGKRLRPLMFLECYNMFKGALSPYINNIACAIESIHISSLVHDDMPCMDDDTERRGIPTAHIKFGETLALLSGDALLNLAYETLIDAIGESNCDPLVVEGCRIIAKAAGGSGMLGGQTVDLQLQKATQPPADPRREVEYIYRNKTGALFMSAIKAGAVMAGVSGGDLENITAFARDFGFAFQLLDDYNEITDAAQSGKAVDPWDSPYFTHFGMEEGIATLQRLTAAATAQLAGFSARFDTRFFADLLAEIFH